MFTIRGMEYRNLIYHLYTEDEPYQISAPYIRVQNQHLFFNPVYMTYHDVPDALKQIREKQNQKIHVFLGVLDGNTIQNLVLFLNECRLHEGYQPKIVVHVSKVSECADVIRRSMEGYPWDWKLSIESKPMQFKINDSFDLQVAFGGGCMNIGVRLLCLGSEAPYLIDYEPGTKKHPTGPMANVLYRKDPDRFKQKIIESFKAQCPPGILASFHSDEDIWNYVMQANEWNIKVEE